MDLVHEPAGTESLSRAPVALVLNARARSGDQGIDSVRKMFAELGLALADARTIEDPEALPEVVRSLAEAGARRIIVGGGDGTLSCAANALAGHDVTLAVLPLGTANDFARTLRIPRRLDAACAVAVHGVPRSIDLGNVNGRYFLNAASIGLTTQLAEQIRPALKKRAGKLAYPVAAASEALKLDPFRVVLTCDEDTRELDALVLVVGNGRFHGGGRMIAPEASLTDQLLDVYAILASGSEEQPVGEEAQQGALKRLWTLARVATLVGRGRHLEHPAVTHLRTRGLILRSHPPLRLNVDGELLGETPAVIRVVPRALRVLVPPPRA